jgi:hypothetical protein
VLLVKNLHHERVCLLNINNGVALLATGNSTAFVAIDGNAIAGNLSQGIDINVEVNAVAQVGVRGNNLTGNNVGAAPNDFDVDVLTQGAAPDLCLQLAGNSAGDPGYRLQNIAGTFDSEEGAPLAPNNPALPLKIGVITTVAPGFCSAIPLPTRP